MFVQRYTRSMFTQCSNLLGMLNLFQYNNKFSSKTCCLSVIRWCTGLALTPSNCVQIIFTLEMCHTSLQNYCKGRQICLVVLICFSIQSNANAVMVLIHLKFHSLPPFTIANLDCVRKPFHDISLLNHG